MTANLLGSRISLISNKDIRYEGILFAINQQESSVTLQNGACLAPAHCCCIVHRPTHPNRCLTD